MAFRIVTATIAKNNHANTTHIFLLKNKSSLGDHGRDFSRFAFGLPSPVGFIQPSPTTTTAQPTIFFEQQELAVDDPYGFAPIPSPTPAQDFAPPSIVVTTPVPVPFVPPQITRGFSLFFL